MAILELLIIIIKTIILSSIYSSIVLLVLTVITKRNEDSIFAELVKDKMKFWIFTHFLISVFLLFISFKYSQETGLGDNSSIPIGYGQTIENEDFESTYFYPELTRTESNKDELKILNYKISSNKLCAEVSNEDNVNPKFDFIVYDLPNRNLMKFKTEIEYNNFAIENKLSLKKDFHDFATHFNEYLANRPFWKIWLIP